MFPGTIAATTPDKAAVVDAATGTALTYRELDDNSARLANHLDELGLRPGDTIAMVSRNNLHMFEVYWAAIRSGLYVTAINHHLTADETAYILTDSAAKVLFADAAVAEAVSTSGDIAALAEAGHRIAWGGVIDGFEPYDDVLAAAPDTLRTDEPRGTDMLYSSGTTGRPKGFAHRYRMAWSQKSPMRTPRSSARCTDSTPRASTYPQRRCITLRHCAFAASPILSAAPWCSWTTSSRRKR